MSQGAPGIGFRVASRFELREALGDGTFGTAWKAYDEERGRAVVIKFLPPVLAKRAAIVKRFEAVWRARVSREDQGLVRVLDVGRDGERPWVAIEYLEGLSLRQLIEARAGAGSPLAFSEVEPILEEIGQILNRLHVKGVHGGLKPENVFLLPDRVVLCDDGLTEIIPVEVYARVQIKLPHAAPYMAPELLSQPDALNREIDLFGLAAVTWALLAGEDPTLPPASLESQRQDLPRGIDAVLGRGLAEYPNERQPTVSTFLLELARLGTDTVKIKILEDVVAAEARAAAEAAMAVSRAAAEEEAADPPSAFPLPPESAPPVKPVESAFEADDRAASLFDDLPQVVEESTPAEVPVAPDDLLQTTPAIGVHGGAGKGIWIAVVVVALLGGVGALAALGVLPVPGFGEKKPAEIDPRLKAAVEGVIGQAERAASAIVDAGGEDVRKREDFRRAAGQLDGARAALAGGDPAEALQRAQAAEAAFAKVLSDLERELEDARRAKEAEEEAKRKAAAESEKAVAAESEKAVAAGSEKAVAAEKRAAGCPDGMVEIPAGSFLYGSPPDDLLRDVSERPQERRKVGAYCIDRWEYPGDKGTFPKTKVTRDEAAALCAKAKKRLCSELEWERACKGPDSLDFPYGKAWDAGRCNTEDAAGNDRKLAKAGAFEGCRSAFGVEDMSGNVMEWTSSAMEQNASLAIAKGGSFTRPDYASRCAYRYTTPPDTLDGEIGFRCCTDKR